MITSFRLKIESIVITLLSQQRKYVWLPMVDCRQPRSFAMIILAQQGELLKEKFPFLFWFNFIYISGFRWFLQAAFISLCSESPASIQSLTYLTEHSFWYFFISIIIRWLPTTFIPLSTCIATSFPRENYFHLLLAAPLPPDAKTKCLLK